MPAWSMQTGVAATHHTVLKRISMNVFVSVVTIALLTRILLVFPSSACLFYFFCCFNSPLTAPLGQFKVDTLLVYSFTGYIGHEPDFWVAHRVALCLSFLFLLDSHCFCSRLSLG